jgi:hypothetical protein
MGRRRKSGRARGVLDQPHSACVWNGLVVAREHQLNVSAFDVCFRIQTSRADQTPRRSGLHPRETMQSTGHRHAQPRAAGGPFVPRGPRSGRGVRRPVPFVLHRQPAGALRCRDVPAAPRGRPGQTARPLPRRQREVSPSAARLIVSFRRSPGARRRPRRRRHGRLDAPRRRTSRGAAVQRSGFMDHEPIELLVGQGRTRAKPSAQWVIHMHCGQQMPHLLFRMALHEG